MGICNYRCNVELFYWANRFNFNKVVYTFGNALKYVFTQANQEIFKTRSIVRE